ncbi:MAG: fumarylacetoacetate hydrolase family protein [Phycisphaerae bacterium]|nr:fumarylacetoacetate hydrolase family protein [Phycisphaerae bacterium]
MKRFFLAVIVLVAAGCASTERTSPASTAAGRVIKYARFQVDGREAYGVVKGDLVDEIAGCPFGCWRETGRSYPVKDVRLLVPVKPTKVLAMAGNYASHLDQQPKPKNPELFFKVPSCLIGPGDAVVLPAGSKEVHLEGELVIVIGKRARNVSEAEALNYVLGVTCGNDISARDWQANDRQWWRAKGTDTFGPCGPFVVSGINYDDLLLTSRVNGQVTQQQRTSGMVFNCSQIVSFASCHVTLEPGDLIFTGTMGKTPAIKAGDVLEVEIEHVGVLRNPVVAEK